MHYPVWLSQGAGERMRCEHARDLDIDPAVAASSSAGGTGGGTPADGAPRDGVPPWAPDDLAYLAVGTGGV
jgi:hypothetical protein